MTPSKPIFQSVVDLGLRDVGVKNERRRLAVQLAKVSLQSYLLILLSVCVSCALIRATGRWAAFPLALVWTAALVALAIRNAKRSPIVVVRTTADRPSRVGWVLVAPFVLLSLHGALRGDPLVIPPAVLTLLMVVLVWRGRGRIPEVLRRFRELLGPDEAVLGDGIGAARGTRRWDEGFRLVVATDRRLLVVGSPRSSRGFVLVDVAYERVSRFGIDWKVRGRAGVLTLAVDAVGDQPTETHVISAISPANLVSIARALRAHGVPPEDPAVVDEAEELWEQALAGSRRKAREPLIDRQAMNTRAFDRGLWLLLALSAAAFYFNPSASPLILALVVLGTSGAAGYVAGTGSSLAYLVPFNLLLAPALFFMFTSNVIYLMVGLSLIAALGLWLGAWVRRATGRRAPATGEPRPPRGTLRYTIGGVSLIRLSAILLACALALTAVGSAAGFDSTALRMLYDQKTAKQLPVDGGSNLTGGAASFTYTRGRGLHELVTDQHFGAGPYDGARWELRSSWTENLNVVSLASYIETPRLDSPAAVARFVARKDREHRGLAGHRLSHTVRVVDGRKGYVWNHGSDRGYWFFAAWFPRPGYTVRVECVAKKEKERFKRLCAEAMGSLRFHRP